MIPPSSSSAVPRAPEDARNTLRRILERYEVLVQALQALFPKPSDPRLRLLHFADRSSGQPTTTDPIKAPIVLSKRTRARRSPSEGILHPRPGEYDVSASPALQTEAWSLMHVVIKASQHLGWSVVVTSDDRTLLIVGDHQFQVAVRERTVRRADRSIQPCGFIRLKIIPLRKASYNGYSWEGSSLLDQAHLARVLWRHAEMAGVGEADCAAAAKAALEPCGPLTRREFLNRELDWDRSGTALNYICRAALIADSDGERIALGKIAKRKGWAIIRTIYDPSDRAQLLDDAKARKFECILESRDGLRSITPVRKPLTFSDLLPIGVNLRRSGYRGLVLGGVDTIRRVSIERILERGPQRSVEIAKALFREDLAVGSSRSVVAQVTAVLEREPGVLDVGLPTKTLRRGRWEYTFVSRYDLSPASRVRREREE